MSKIGNYKLKFGKYKGKSLNQVSLLYLDWLVDQNIYGELKDILEIYLNEPSIKKELDDLLEEREETIEY